MMGTRKIVTVIVGLQLSACLASAEVMLTGAERGRWTMDLAAAGELARANKLPILLDFTGSDWCGWCKLMDRQVFTQEAWIAFARESLALVKIDFPRDREKVPRHFWERNAELQTRYQVSGYPTYVILDADGKTELGRLGADRAATPERFRGQVQDVIRSTAGHIERFVSQLAPETAATYRELSSRHRSLSKTFDAWVAAQPAETEENINKFLAFRTDLGLIKRQLERIEVQQQAEKLDPASATQYLAIFTQLQNVEASYDEWLASRPVDNQESRQKQVAMQEQMNRLRQQLAIY